jgi:PAS domain S-box-containing protein
MPHSADTIRILIIDDDHDDFLIISDYLKTIDPGRFSIDWCYQYAEAVKLIEKRGHNIYFVDYRLGAKTGLDLLRDAEAMKCDDPIILLTGFGNPAVDNEAMRIGAMDYLIKSELTTEKLERCIRYALERSAAIKALRANEQKYRNIFERSKDAIFITDTELRFKDINLATSQLLEFDKADLVGKSLYDLIEDKAIQAKIREGLSEAGEVFDLEIVLNDKSQEKKFFVLTASTQQETSGDRYIQAILHDITNLKRAERATLYAEKLASAGRLVRTLAHEVRNPLNNVQMAVEQINTAHILEDDKIFLEIIQRNSKRIDNLIAELLDSYRPYEKTLKVTNLRNILEDTIHMASDRVKLKGIKLSVNFPGEPCIIQADEEKLKIAFLNIVVNATEAIENGNGVVDIELSEKPEHYVVEITDNGCGIPSEILAKLFEPYFTSKRNGMGLGLASTLNIIQSHGGTIDVESQVNLGSRFIVSFPKTQDKEFKGVSLN